MKRLAVAFVFIAASSLPLCGQAAPAPSTVSSGEPGYQITGENDVVNFAEFARPRRMIYYFQADPEEFSAFDRSVLYRSVLMAVGSANPNVVVLESPDAEVPATSRGKEELARQIDADCWLLVSAFGGMDNARFEAATFDILKQQTFGAQVIEPGYPLDYRTITQGFWDSVAATIRNDYGSVVDTLRVTVRGLSGTRVSGLGSSEMTINENGELAVTLPNPATYTISATAPGYYPVTRTFYLGYSPVTEELQQVRAARMGVDLAGSTLQFPSAHFWYFPVPATLYLRGGVTTYAVGLYLVNSTPAVLQGNPLTRLELGAGWYFTAPGKSLRTYAGADLMVRIAHGVNVFGIDSYAPIAGAAVAGIEYSPTLSFHFFAEYNPTIYLTPDSAAFRLVSFPEGQTIGGFLFANGYSIDLRSYSVGVRFTW